jgi:hypothetical protein
MFAPILKQTIPHPQHTWLLSTALTLAALGISQHQLTKFKSRLQPGVHWIEEIGSDRVRRHFYTRAGVLELCDLVCSDRADQLQQTILDLSGNGGAIIPRPPTTAIHESQWQPRQHDPLLAQAPTPVSIQPNQGGLEIQIPAVSGNLFHDPRVYELLQLKRDELEIRRSELENERLRLMHEAYTQRSPVLPVVQQQPELHSTPVRYQELEDSPRTASQPPININVNVENKADGAVWCWDTLGFMEMIFCLVLLTLFSFGVVTLLVSVSPKHSALPEVSRHV